MFTRLYLVLTILLLTVPTCLAQPPGRDMTREKVITDQLTAIEPGAVEDFKAATTAMDSGNYGEAVRLYEAVRMKAPEFDPVLRRLRNQSERKSRECSRDSILFSRFCCLPSQPVLLSFRDET